MQDVLGAGIRIDQTQLQKVDPPTQVIDAFRDVQAAAADKERLQNEAVSYASRIVPEARGDAERILQGARLSRAVGRRGNRPDRSLPQDLRRIQEGARCDAHAYVFESMERIMTGTDMIIIDSRNARSVVSFLSLEPLRRKKDMQD
jgi:membrane protease subunit HflK